MVRVGFMITGLPAVYNKNNYRFYVNNLGL